MNAAWQNRAACLGADPGLFFPMDGTSAKPAKAVCAVCPVRAACLDFALDNNERHGVWGGLTERQRRPLRKARRAA